MRFDQCITGIEEYGFDAHTVGPSGYFEVRCPPGSSGKIHDTTPAEVENKKGLKRSYTLWGESPGF
jgi:hypothetical protein